MVYLVFMFVDCRDLEEDSGLVEWENEFPEGLINYHTACLLTEERWRLLHLPYIAQENPKNSNKNAQKSSKNLKRSINNVIITGRILQSNFLCADCALLAGLGSQGIVVKFTAPSFPHVGINRCIHGKKYHVQKINV